MGRATVPNPVPSSPEEWLDEIAAGYVEAIAATPFARLLGEDLRPSRYFHLAPAIAIDFRHMKRTPALLKKATDAALGSHVSTEERFPEITDDPLLAFSLAYLASHFGMELVTEAVVEGVMAYVDTHRVELLHRVATMSPR